MHLYSPVWLIKEVKLHFQYRYHTLTYCADTKQCSDHAHQIIFGITHELRKSTDFWQSRSVMIPTENFLSTASDFTWATSTLIRFRMPPFLIQRKRIQISASTLAFSNRFRPSTRAMRKRYVFVLRGRLIIEFMTSAFSPVHTDTKGILFRKSPPWKAFSKASVFVGQSIRYDRRKRIQKYAFSNENGLVCSF